MILKMTQPQFLAIINLRDDIETMIGCGDNDKQWVKDIKLIDRMLKNNKLIRNKSIELTKE